MRRLLTKRESLVKWEGKICPRIVYKLWAVEDKSRQCNVHHAGDWKYEVEHNDDVWSVNLETRLCSCGQWQISGVPCIHSVAAIIKKRVHIEDYIDSCFAIETYKKTYEGLIYPVPGINQWPEVSEEEKVLPPPFRKQPGRPKKKRIKAVDEDVEKKGGFRRQYKMMRCSRCKQLGHNVRGCKNGRVMETRDEDQQDCGQDGGAATHGSCRPMEKITKEGDLGLGLEWDDGGILNKLATKQFRVRKDPSTKKRKKTDDVRKPTEASGKKMKSIPRRNVGFLSGSGRDLGCTGFIPPRSGIVSGVVNERGRWKEHSKGKTTT